MYVSLLYSFSILLSSAPLSAQLYSNSSLLRLGFPSSCSSSPSLHLLHMPFCSPSVPCCSIVNLSMMLPCHDRQSFIKPSIVLSVFWSNPWTMRDILFLKTWEWINMPFKMVKVSLKLKQKPSFHVLACNIYMFVLVCCKCITFNALTSFLTAATHYANLMGLQLHSSSLFILTRIILMFISMSDCCIS